jgi:hypothetical protein
MASACIRWRCDNAPWTRDPTILLAPAGRRPFSWAAELTAGDATVRLFCRASLIETWVDETERRTWFLFEASRHGAATGH